MILVDVVSVIDVASVAKRWILKEILGERCDFYRLLYGTEFGN